MRKIIDETMDSDRGPVGLKLIIGDEHYEPQSCKSNTVIKFTNLLGGETDRNNQKITI